jgi:hypothetical protein
MPDAFRNGVRNDLSRLLSHWKAIELWIKRAEQVNKKAVIPAINELRYASRQLFQAVRLLEKETLSPGDESIIAKRLIIAEQYLLNADHDVCDAIVGYYEVNIEYLDNTYGVSSITLFFVDYPKLRETVKTCSNLISASRGEYDDRKKNYDALRSNHFQHLINAHEQITNAEAQAKAAKEEIERQLTIAKGKIKIMEWITVAGTVFGLLGCLGLPLSIFLWMVGPQSFCAAHSTSTIFGYLCQFAATDEPNAANIPSTDVIPGP